MELCVNFARAFSLALVLLAPAATSAQTAADRSWPGFWRQFTSAVRSKNRAAVERLMSSEADFITTGGIGSRNDFLKMFDDKELERKGALVKTTVPANFIICNKRLDRFTLE